MDFEGDVIRRIEFEEQEKKEADKIMEEKRKNQQKNLVTLLETAVIEEEDMNLLNLPIKIRKYFRFYEKSKSVNLNPGLNVDYKRVLLASFFNRFSRGGKQPVWEMDSLKAGSLFRYIVEYSRGKIEKYKR
jgi:hypothetical protein